MDSSPGRINTSVENKSSKLLPQPRVFDLCQLLGYCGERTMDELFLPVLPGPFHSGLPRGAWAYDER